MALWKKKNVPDKRQNVTGKINTPEIHAFMVKTIFHLRYLLNPHCFRVSTSYFLICYTLGENIYLNFCSKSFTPISLSCLFLWFRIHFQCDWTITQVDCHWFFFLEYWWTRCWTWRWEDSIERLAFYYRTSDEANLCLCCMSSIPLTLF